MTLRSELVDDAAAALADVGESVVYYDAGNVNAGRTILAFIDRGEPAPRVESSDKQGWLATIHILNNATTGRTAPSYADLVDIPLRQGATPARCRVTRIVSGDVGCWSLEVSR